MSDEKSAGGGAEPSPPDEFWGRYDDYLTRYQHGVRAGELYLTEYLPSWKDASFLLRTKKYGKASWTIGRGKIALLGATASVALAMTPNSGVEIELMQRLTDAALTCGGAVGAIAIAGTGLGFVVFLIQTTACVKSLVEVRETLQVKRGTRSIDEPGVFEKNGLVGEGAGILIDAASLGASVVNTPLKVLSRMGAKNIVNLGGRGGAMMRLYRDRVSTVEKIFHGFQATQVLASLAPYAVKVHDEARMEPIGGHDEVARQIKGLLLAPSVSPFDDIGVGDISDSPPFGLGGFRR